MKTNIQHEETCVLSQIEVKIAELLCYSYFVFLYEVKSTLKAILLDELNGSHTEDLLIKAKGGQYAIKKFVAKFLNVYSATDIDRIAKLFTFY